MSVINGAAKVDDGIIEPDIQIMEKEGGEVHQPMAKKRKHSDTSSDNNSDHIINKPKKSKVCSWLLL